MQVTAKAALTQIVNLVFQRLEKYATAVLHASAEQPAPRPSDASQPEPAAAAPEKYAVVIRVQVYEHQPLTCSWACPCRRCVGRPAPADAAQPTELVNGTERPPEGPPGKYDLGRKGRWPEPAAHSHSQ